eukprot:504946-Pelagomonas_calceolata.AAC.7
MRFNYSAWGNNRIFVQQDMPSAGHALEALLSTHQGRGAGPAPVHISKLLRSQLAVHSTVDRAWTAKSLNGSTPDPGHSKGIQNAD